MTKIRPLLPILALLGAGAVPSWANVSVNAGATAAQIRTLLEGTGVTIGPVTVTGAASQWGSFEDGTVDSSGTGDPTVNIEEGLVISTGDVADAPGPNNSNASSDPTGNAPADADLSSIQTNAVNDTLIVEFTVVAQDDFLEFNFAFASEEYNEYVCSNFNDVLGIFVRDLGGPFSGGGVNAATAPQSNDIVSINTINNGTVGSNGSAANCLSLDNAALYKDNAGGANLVYDGLTANISKFVTVTPGVTYTVKIVIADAGDSSFDSAAFFGPINSATTQALITDFDVTDANEVLWTTSSQSGTLGFDVEELRDGTWELVNEHPLPARADAPQGAHYRFRAEELLGPGPFRLVETEVGGKTRIYGPFERKAAEETGFVRTALASAVEFSSMPRRETEASTERRQIARAARREESAELVRRRSASNQSSSLVLVEVPTSGLGRLAATDLMAELGLSFAQVQNAISSGGLRIVDDGEAIPWTAEGTDVFFLGRPPQSIFSAHRWYQVSLGNGAPMNVVDGGQPASLGSPTVYTTTLQVETDAFAGTAAASDPLGDFWFWAAFAAGNPSFDTQTFDVTVPHVVPNSAATLELELFGTTDPTAGDDHQVTTSVNGGVVGSHAWSGVGSSVAQLSLGAGVLEAGDNEVQITADLLPQVATSFPYLDALSFTYERLAIADQGLLELVAPATGVVTVEGLGSASVIVVQDTGSQPVRVVNLTVEGAGSNVSFEVSAGERYVIADAASLAAAPLVTKSPHPLPNVQTSADLVVFAPPELRVAAEQYAADRAASGVDAVVVDTEAIWLAYSQGIADPRALRAFLADAWEKWSRPPAYALIVGHGDYDYQDRLGAGENLVPPLLVETLGGLYSSDMVLGDVSGSDGVPEIVVGRLPVLSGAELLEYGDKLASAELPGASRWNHVALLGDNRDEAGPFDANVAELSKLLPASTTQEQILLDELSVAEARQQLQSAFIDGSQIVTYVGHGGLDQLAAEGLLTAGDVSGLASDGQLPLLLSLTCSVGRFEVPGFDSLAEALAIDPDSGATAVIAPSGVSFNTSANLLGRFFLEQAVASSELRLGDVARAALEQYLTFGDLGELAKIYNVLGDPSLQLWSDSLVDPVVPPASLIFETGFESTQDFFPTLVEPRDASN
ncbi:MAG: C25 family cysteine peptidase [Acidobacteriota bacterium]